MKQTLPILMVLVLSAAICFSSCGKKISDEEDGTLEAFSIAGAEASIDYDNQKIVLTVPYGTDLSKASPLIKVGKGVTIEPGPGVPQDFTDSAANPILYRITTDMGYESYFYVTVVPGEPGAKSPGDDEAPGMPPVAPVGLIASASSPITIDLSWSEVSGAQSYNVYSFSDVSGEYELIGKSDNTSYLIGGLNPAKHYFYKVSAVNAYGESIMTHAAGATTAPVVNFLAGTQYDSDLGYGTWTFRDDMTYKFGDGGSHIELGVYIIDPSGLTMSSTRKQSTSTGGAEWIDYDEEWSVWEVKDDTFFIENNVYRKIVQKVEKK